MHLYDLGKQPWDDSQLFYHALAELGREGLILLSPAAPYVCLGFHQDPAKEVDLEFCRREAIPVFRREVGGGAVYLDGDQLFFQLVLRRDNPLLPASKDAFYRRFLQPVVDVYRRVGIAAEYKPVNDVIAGARKISGSGVGEIGPAVVFVGNLIVDFNYEMMARVLKVPDEKFRDKVHKTLRENLSTIRRELGPEKAAAWSEARLNGLLAAEFAKLLGPLSAGTVDPAWRARADALRAKMLDDAWLFQRGTRIPASGVKIRDGVHVLRNVHKAPGGLMRADFELREGRFAAARISGDFFCYPPQAVGQLEAALEGRRASEVKQVIADFSAANRFEAPGIDPEDWAAVLKA
jgi:lipoate-protein ligase A